MTLAVAVGMVIGAAIYSPFANSHWSTISGIAGVCAAYTVIIFGLARSVEDCTFAAEKAQPPQAIFLVHCVFLALVAEVINFGLYIKPRLPAWLDESSWYTRSGRPAATWFELLEMATLFIIFCVEFIWLLKNMPNKTDNLDSAA
ncbi:MAG: hypothetical protein WAK26_12210 [Terracidiphilus sp.]